MCDSDFPVDMEDLAQYKRAMKVIKPVDAFEAFLANFSKNLSIKFSRSLTSKVTRKPKETYRSKNDNIMVTDEKFNNVPVRIYKPTDLKENEKSGAVIFIHGGYWFIYDVEDYDQLMYTLANKTRALVASIEYTRTPEAQYPVAINEIYESTKYLVNNLDKYNIDKKRIAIAGDTTGGNMAASLVHRLRKENIDLKLSCLIHAPLQYVDLTLPSYQQNEKANHLNILSYIGLSRIIHEYLGIKVPPNNLSNNSHISATAKSQLSRKVPWNLLPEKYTSLYKPINVNIDKPPVEDNSKLFDENVSPLLADDETLKLCPKTYVVTSEYDIFRDDGFIYAARLKNMGVDAVVKNYETGYHGALNLLQNEDFKFPKKLFNDFIQFIKEYL